MKNVAIFIALILCLLISQKIEAQGSDPALATAILLHKPKAVSTISVLAGAKTTESGSLLWMKKNDDKITEYHETLDSYMQKLHNNVVYVSQFLGMFIEIQQTIDNMKAISKEISEHPDNAVALSVSNQRNTIYADIESTGSELVKSVTIFLKKDKNGNRIRMTEQERMDAICKVVPHLSHLNTTLRKVLVLLKCTDFGTVWDQITGDYRINKQSKIAIINECVKRRNDRLTAVARRN